MFFKILLKNSRIAGISKCKKNYNINTLIYDVRTPYYCQLLENIFAQKF